MLYVILGFCIFNTVTSFYILKYFVSIEKMRKKALEEITKKGE